MIRKILFGSFLIYLSVWLFISHLLENKLQQNLSNYKDLSIEYTNIKATGFPSKWEFQIISPVIKSNSESFAIETSNINIKIGITCKEFVFSMSDIAKLTIFGDAEENKVYNVVFNRDPSFEINIKNPVFRENNIIENFQNIVISPFLMMVSKDDTKIIEIKNNLASINNFAKQDFRIECDVLCDANSDITKFTKLSLSAFAEIKFASQDSNKIMIQGLSVKTLEIKVDDEANLDFSGEMVFNQNTIPEGKFVLNLYNYNELVDYLWPSSSGLSDAEIKSIIEKCNMDSGIENAHLPIEFSEEGLNIGQEIWQTLRME